MSDGDQHYIDFQPYPAKKNTVYLLARNQVHSLPLPAPHAKVLILAESFFDSIEQDKLRFLFVPLSNEGIHIPNELVDPLHNLFNLMVLECLGNNEATLQHCIPARF